MSFKLTEKNDDGNVTNGKNDLNVRIWRTSPRALVTSGNTRPSNSLNLLSPPDSTFSLLLIKHAPHTLIHIYTHCIYIYIYIYIYTLRIYNLLIISKPSHFARCYEEKSLTFISTLTFRKWLLQLRHKSSNYLFTLRNSITSSPDIRYASRDWNFRNPIIRFCYSGKILCFCVLITIL